MKKQKRKTDNKWGSQQNQKSQYCSLFSQLWTVVGSSGCSRKTTRAKVPQRFLGLMQRNITGFQETESRLYLSPFKRDRPGPM